MFSKFKRFLILLFCDYVVYRKSPTKRGCEFAYYDKATKKIYFTRSFKKRSNFKCLSVVKILMGFKQYNKSPLYTYHSMTVRELYLRGFNPNNPLPTDIES